MRIWIINQYVLPPGQAGGTRHFSQARELISLGHEVLLVTGSFHHLLPSHFARSKGPSLVIESIQGVTFAWLKTPSYLGNGLGRLWNNIIFAARVLHNPEMQALPTPDVVVGSSPHLFGAWAAGRFARRNQAPFLLEIRDLWPQTLIDIGGFSPYHPVIQVFDRLERNLYHRADHIISLLPDAWKHITARGALKENITWIPNGVDLKFMPRAIPPQESSVFRIMYAGYMSVTDDLKTVLNAAYQLERDGFGDRVCFDLIGDGPEKNHLVKLAARLGLRSVHFHEPVPKTEIYAVMAKADAFVVTMLNSPLYRFGMSYNKMYDYLAMARPIIFANNAVNNPVEEAGAGLTVAPEDSIGLAACVKQLLAMTPADRWEMGQRGRTHVEAHYDIRILAKKLENIMLQVVARIGSA